MGNDRHVSNDNVGAHHAAGTMPGAGDVRPRKKFPPLKESVVLRGQSGQVTRRRGSEGTERQLKRDKRRGTLTP